MTLVGLETERKVLLSALKHAIPTLCIGETGCGKTSLVQECAASLGRQVVRVNLDGGTTPDELVGRCQLRGKETVFELGILPYAMTNGAVLLLDELNAALPDTLFAIHAVLEQSPRLLIPETGQEILPAKGFTVVATCNPSHEYAGTKALNPALYSRFGVVLRFVPLGGKDLLMALTTHVPEAKAPLVAKVGEMLELNEKLRKEEQITTRLTVREGIAALRLATNGLTESEALAAALFGKLEALEQPVFAQQYKKMETPSVEDTQTIQEVLALAAQAEEFKKALGKAEKRIDGYTRVREIIKAMKAIGAEE